MESTLKGCNNNNNNLCIIIIIIIIICEYVSKNLCGTFEEKFSL